MVRTTERKLTFWLAGYYDDFTNAKAVPDDSNIMGSTWKSIETHAGNPLNGLSPYNPRYKFAWFIRGTGASGANFNGFSSMSATIQADRYLHNNKIGEWLTFDPEWYNQGQYEGTTHIQYPDSKTNANRQKFDGATGLIGAAYDSADPKEGFLIFCNGYNTQGQYYAFTGNTDSSYGRDDMVWLNDESSGYLNSAAGEPNNAPAPTYRIDTHLAGVYTGEVVTDFDIVSGGLPSGGGGASMFLPPIHSPSRSPFLVQEIYNSVASGFIPTLVYQGSLNCKGDNDIFTIRICPMSNTPSTGGKTKLLFGNSNNPIGITSGTSGDSTDGTYAVDYLLTTKPYGAMLNLNGWDADFVDSQSIGKWDDYEFILDFTNQNYQVVTNGGATGGLIAFNAHPDGRDWTPVDFYGWELQVEYTVNKATILVDRVGVCRHLNDFPANSQSGIVQNITPIGASMQFDAQVNGQSTMSVNITDDENTLKLLAFFNGDSYADWSLLAFRDNIDRPFYRGSLKGMTHTFNAADRKPIITINSSDHFSDLDHQIPIWELGEDGDADSTNIVSYNRQDSQNRISTYYFGASPLQIGNASLGFNEVEDGTGTWESHVDSRMRLRSAHPIQIYNDEDEFGINNAYEEWDDAITDGFATSAAQYRSLHSRWIQDFPKSQWFNHLFGKIKSQPLLSAKLLNPFSRGDTTITLDCGATTLANGGHIEIVNHLDGSVDSGVITSAVHSETYTDIQVAWVHVYATFEGTTLFNDNTDDIQNSQEASHALAVALVPTGTNLHHRIFEIRNSQWEVFNNAWGFSRMDIQVRKSNSSGASITYELYTLSNPITQPPPPVNIFNPQQFAVDDWRSSNSNHILKYRGAPLKTDRQNWDDITTEDGISQDYVDDVWNNRLNFTPRPSSITVFATTLNIPAVDVAAHHFVQVKGNLQGTTDPIWAAFNPLRRIDSFVSIGGVGSQLIGRPHIVQDAVGGNTVCTLPAKNFFQRNHTNTPSQHHSVNVLDISNDFKHLYVLWADMRNNGNANADAYFRKDEFGLMKPSSQNYELSLVFGDQNTDSGQERQEFVDLIAGEDYDLWEMNSKDPITDTLWSAVSGGSNSESDSKYHNWEDKAGAFVIIDTSKFFNLNTHSNGGMSGQISGGRKEINDYIVETEGFPILLDNYWKRATTTPANMSNYKSWASYYFLTDNLSTTLREEVRLTDRAIQLASSIIPVKGSAETDNWRMPTSKIVSQEKETVIHFNTHGKVGSVSSLTLTAIDPATSTTTAGAVFITGSTANLAYLRDGHFIKISSSTTTPTIDGTYRLKVHPNCTTGNASWVGKIILADPTTTIVAGTGTVEAEHTYKLNRLMNLGQIEKATKTPNTWDGSSYSNIGFTAPFTLNQVIYIDADATTNTLTFAGVFTPDWRDFGFRKGMILNINSPTVPDNNGLHTILDIQDSGFGVHDRIVVENISLTHTYHNDADFTDYYYNPNSADWLINNKPLQNLRVAPNETTYKNTTTGANPFHEGAVDAILLDGDTGFTDAVVYANASSVMPMRLMMQMQGFIKNKGSMTFNEHDKFRVTYLDSLTKNWLNQANLFGIPDIGTIPRTNSMNIGQKDAMTSGRAGVITTVTIPPSAPAGTNEFLSVNHGLVTGDTIEIISNNVLSSISVPPYSTQYVVTALNADEIRITTDNTSSPTHLGMWRKISSVDTFGSIVDCRNTTITNIYSQVKQVSGVGDTNGVRSVLSYYMSRDSKPAFRPTYSNGFVLNDNNITLSSLNTQSAVQASNVRVFYGADGNYVDHPQVVLGAKPRWEIIQAPELSTSDEALVVAKQEFEKIKKAPLAITGSITKLSDNHTLDGANDRMLYNARFGYIADQSRTIPFYKSVSGNAFDHAMYWTSLRGGNLFTGIQNALDGRLGTSTSPSGSTVLAGDNYNWYGANSVSYATQVVHIPHGMPKSSNDTAAAGKVKADGRLRIVIDIAPETASQKLNLGTEIDNGTYLFRVHLLDYDFEPSGSSPATGTATVKSQTSVTVDSNGLYEIPIPSTYWTGQTGNERILLSVNYDYLASLVKLRCGGGFSTKRKNAHDWEGATYSAGHNPSSIFPLGVRKFGTAGYWGARAEYYAPRLNITDDLNFTVGTTLKYTNSRLNMTNESLSIKSLSWNIDGRDSENVVLNLERDVSRAAKGFASYILPKVDMGGKQKASGGGGRSLSPSLNPPKGKGGKNQGKPQQGNRQDKFGDEIAGTRRSSTLQPNITPPRDNTPDGSVSSSSGNIVIGSSALSTNVNRRIKGTMDFNNSSMVGDKFSILGQKKPAQAPRNTNADQSIDSFIIPEGGNAVMGTNGFTLAGRGQDGGISVYGSTKIHLRVPANPQSNSIRVFGRASLPTLSASAEVAVVFATATCVETGDSIESTVQIEARTDGSAQTVVFITGNLRGADIAGNTIELLLEREAGRGSDTAMVSALSVHNIQIASDTRSVSGKSKTNEFSYGL